MEEEEEMEVEEDRFVIVSHLPIECLPSEALFPLTLAILPILPPKACLFKHGLSCDYIM